MVTVQIRLSDGREIKHDIAIPDIMNMTHGSVLDVAAEEAVRLAIEDGDMTEEDRKTADVQIIAPL